MGLGRIAAAVLLALAVSGCASSKFKRYEGPEVTSLLLYKSQRELMLLHGNQVLKSYKVGLGFQPVGDKEYEGDGRTPEGLYYIDRRNPNSTYHLSIGISYPNPDDVQVARALGRSPGGDIFIHGQAGQNRGRSADWTAGCIAVPDEDIEDIYAMVRDGTPIYLMP